MYICQICKKNPATIHLTDIHNNVKKEVHICETCATEKGFNFQGASNLPQLLGLAAKKSLHSAASPSPSKTAKSVEDNQPCPKCGATWGQFGERGRLGCPEEYRVFEAKLRQLVVNQIAPHAAGRGSFHVGKKPGPRREADKLEETVRGLKKKLRRAVAEENYETAAALKAELELLCRENTGQKMEPETP